MTQEGVSEDGIPEGSWEAPSAEPTHLQQLNPSGLQFSHLWNGGGV